MFSKINLNITKKNIIPVPWKGGGGFWWYKAFENYNDF